MKPFTQKKIREVDFAGFTQKTTQVYRNDGRLFGVNDLEKIVKSMKSVAEKQKKDMKIVRIFVVNGDKKATWSNVDEFMDYYEGRVKDESKFHDFYQVQITTAFGK
jgi:hypothetical protein